MPRQHSNDYPLWQGPCGEGWNGGITQSMLSNFLSCRERFRLKYVLGLKPPDKWNHRMGYGNMWHVCEEALAHAPGDKHPKEKHESWMWECELLKHTRDMLDHYSLQQEEITKWANVCAVQFPEYVAYWHDHPDVKNRTPLLQEQAFDVPYTLPSGRVVRLRGKWDAVDIIDNNIWLFETKTKGDIDQLQVERQLSFDLQTMLYLVALNKHPHEDYPFNKVGGQGGIPIQGVRYNVIRRPLSGGKGNIKPHCAKSTKTKYVPAETDEHFYERLRADYIVKEPDYWFFRIKSEISAHDIKVFREACLDPLLETLCWWYDQTTNQKVVRFSDSYPPMNYRTPFGIYSALEEGGSTEYDHYMATGSESTLRRVEKLFGELK